MANTLLLLESALLILLTTNLHTAAPGGSESTPAISVDPEGRLLVENERIFPIGIYVAIQPMKLTSHPQETLAMLDDLQDSPLKILVNYGDPDRTLEEKRKSLDEMHKREGVAVELN